MFILRSVLPTAVIVLMTACSTGDGGNSMSVPTVEATETMTQHYPSGRAQASGAVIAGSITRTGEWITYFDDDSGQRQWEGSYVRGAVDQTKPWHEWNRDGSVRFDSSDQ